MTPTPRIVSTLPSATETVFELGLGDQLVGVSHECNYPAAATRRPCVTSVSFNYEAASSRDIDDHVTTSLHRHESLYQIDESLLENLQPTHLLIQQLCEVCAITPTQIQAAITRLQVPPEIVSLAPHSLAGILADIERLGHTLGREQAARRLTAQLRRTITDIRARTATLKPKTVFCAEWLDPLYASGHWVPEMVALAGGQELFGSNQGTARQLSWQQVAKADPDIIILMPCGFSFAKIQAELADLQSLPFWPHLTATRTGQIWIADGPAYFNQSGPRVISGGLPLLAQIIHPEIFGLPHPKSAICVPA